MHAKVAKASTVGNSKLAEAITASSLKGMFPGLVEDQALKEAQRMRMRECVGQWITSDSTVVKEADEFSSICDAILPCAEDEFDLAFRDEVKLAKLVMKPLPPGLDDQGFDLMKEAAEFVASGKDGRTLSFFEPHSHSFRIVSARFGVVIVDAYYYISSGFRLQILLHAAFAFQHRFQQAVNTNLLCFWRARQMELCWLCLRALFVCWFSWSSSAITQN